MIETIKLSKLRIDGGTQARAKINNDAVTSYAESMQDGSEFPPIVAYFDGADYWIGDGFHRYHALTRIERKSAPVDVRKGSKWDAKVHSWGANAAHGLPRTNADKRKIVTEALKDETASKWSDRKIAETCCVSHNLVSEMRRQVSSDDTSSGGQVSTVDTSKRQGRDGKEYEAKPTKPKAAKTSEPTARAKDAPDEPAKPDPPAETPEAKLAELQRPYREAVNAINEIRRTFAKLIEDPKTGAHLGPPWNRIKKALDDAKTPLAQAAPAAWCPKCKGKGCAKCQQAGWLPKSVWDGLPEAEKK